MKILEDASFQKYLEDNEWTVECESPLEVRNKDGSFATQYAAKVLVNELYNTYKDENSIASVDDDNVQAKAFERLEKLFNQMDQYIQSAWQTEHDNPANADDEDRLSSIAYDVWNKTYDLVFSANISKKIRPCFDELNVSFDYYDPDTTYKEDVCAYYDAVKNQVESLSKIFKPTTSNKMRM